MGWSQLFATISVAVILTLSIVADPGVEKYQSRHSKTFSKGPYDNNRNSIQALPRGKCIKTVPVSQISRGSHRPVGNSSNPGFSDIIVCCDGYKEYKGFCEPICKNCRNGMCIEPNVCKCLDDFVMSLAEECVNVCSYSCLNGRCNGRNCICNQGYQLDPTRQFCIPQCNRDCGINGNCTAPNVCGCKKGYAFNNKTNMCEAQCNPPCGNGNCYAPGQCSCYPGYFLKDRTCQTNCTRGCTNGRCVAPEQCACDPGWSLNPSRNSCDAVCEKQCQNGICIAPNTCQCLKGFVKESPKSNACKPVCERGCAGGKCVAPNSCQCEPGFTFNSKRNRCDKVPAQPPIYRPHLSVQSPRCTPECINGQCTGKNRCTCYNNYQPDSSQSYKCNPVCANGCANGTCIAPNNCLCNQGFEKKGHNCVSKRAVVTTPRPACRQTCVNGYCQGNKCQCNSGFIQDPANKFRCLPFCQGGCANATCVAPNTCQCLPGYEMKSAKVCEKPIPRCDKACLNGYCVGRNKCQCNRGYEQGNQFNVCTAKCESGCLNGQCLQPPDKCTCNYGYTMHNKVCVWSGQG